MKYQDNMNQVAALQPDYLGFIFYEKSPRNIDNSISKLPENVKKTGVFVNSSVEFIIKKITDFKLQAVQLHGDESPEFCNNLKRHYEALDDDLISLKKTDYHGFSKKTRNDKLEIIKVFSIKNDFDFSILEPYETVCDYFLFDTKGKQPGGNGYTFDWSVLKNYSSTKSYFLSGGIGIDEIDQLLEFLKSPESKYCYAIDVNSKFEIKAGLKDIDKLKTFKNNIITENK